MNDRSRNEVINVRCGVKADVVTKIENRMLRWFGHVERISESRLKKGIMAQGRCEWQRWCDCS